MVERGARWTGPVEREVQSKVIKPTVPTPKVERPELPVRLPAGLRR